VLPGIPDAETGEAILLLKAGLPRLPRESGIEINSKCLGSLAMTGWKRMCIGKNTLKKRGFQYKIVMFSITL